ncbi:hypothetical protein [Thermoanaerobacterium sp. DL9XJH110]|uniref:hypothetical protein n=1 Tax=Thermoanaerobacterium sp. DL9XJH110 TaxID=3386643 RepID=UPI003BB63576
MELLTISKTLPRHLEFSLQDPLMMIMELKKIVKELKEKNPTLKNYRLMDVGFTAGQNHKIPQMRLYFIK